MKSTELLAHEITDLKARGVLQSQFVGPAKITQVVGGHVYKYVLVDAAGATVTGTDSQAKNIASPARILAVGNIVPLYGRDGTNFFCSRPDETTVTSLSASGGVVAEWSGVAQPGANDMPENPPTILQAFDNLAVLASPSAGSSRTGHEATGVEGGAKTYRIRKAQRSYDVAGFLGSTKALVSLRAGFGPTETFLPDGAVGGTFRLRRDAGLHGQPADFSSGTSLGSAQGPGGGFVDVPVDPDDLVDGVLYLTGDCALAQYLDQDVAPVWRVDEFTAQLRVPAPDGTPYAVTGTETLVYTGDVPALAAGDDIGLDSGAEADIRQVVSLDEANGVIALDSPSPGSWVSTGTQGRVEVVGVAGTTLTVTGTGGYNVGTVAFREASGPSSWFRVTDVDAVASTISFASGPTFQVGDFVVRNALIGSIVGNLTAYAIQDVLDPTGFARVVFAVMPALPLVAGVELQNRPIQATRTVAGVNTTAKTLDFATAIPPYWEAGVVLRRTDGADFATIASVASDTRVTYDPLLSAVTPQWQTHPARNDVFTSYGTVQSYDRANREITLTGPRPTGWVAGLTLEPRYEPLHWGGRPTIGDDLLALDVVVHNYKPTEQKQDAFVKLVDSIGKRVYLSATSQGRARAGAWTTRAATGSLFYSVSLQVEWYSLV